MNDPKHRSFLVVDVENSSALGNPQLVAMRATLYELLSKAIPNSDVVVQEDRGDGAMLVLDLPVLDVLDQIVTAFLGGVREHNNTVDLSDWLRVRLAVHEGYVHRDEHGWTGEALTATFRLNNSKLVKQTLARAARAHGVVVVSDYVYQGVVRHEYRDTVTSAGFRDAMISTGDAEVRAWVRVPGYPEPPLSDHTADSPATIEAGAATVAPIAGQGGINANNVLTGNIRADMIVGGNNNSWRA
ncbi:hypothetical protein IRT45_24310 [Nocardia sp. BSTN01]|uniref:hypothetical protein n=1 Tax=Nocardia sp. BSTN01 TaxID=2783665 RepID=UPI0018902EF8|nr:hypothetical protein [Nocardia sp. BSTN01]MBF5000273.1 hypothetical protein [Nocardia sp. BSTN01]